MSVPSAWRGVLGSAAVLLALVCLSGSGADGREPGPLPVRLGQAASAERQLAEKHAPIVMLKRQEAACDADGEPFAPAPVEVVLDDPEVALLDGAAGDRAIRQAPTAADLYRGDEALYLDLPGNPRAPGCAYERHFRQRMGDRPPVAYARIVANRGTEQLALQYWLYYTFNDFNNTHESDWEMLQLRFDARSAAEALGREPVEIALAQHGGGETSAWDDPKLDRDGERPIVYPAAGSHATQYASALYLGWGENGTGFGCDNTTGPSVRLPLAARLIPDGPLASDGAFAWATFRGRWGEKQPWEFNGPTGPNTKVQWTAPFAWQAGLRDASIEVPATRTFGPGPVGLFCDAVGFGSALLTSYQAHPSWVVGVIVGLLVGGVALVFVGRSTLAGAWSLYVDHLRLFVSLGVLLIPIGIIANAVQHVLVTYTPVAMVVAVMGESPGARLAAALTVGGVQHLVGSIVVGPIVIQAVADIRAGRQTGFRLASRAVKRRFRGLAVAVVRRVAIVAALALTVVGIPWAVARTVRWLFVAHAVIVDGAAPRQAAALSAAAVAGRWWHTAGISLSLVAIGALPGPLLGIVLMVAASRSVGFVNGLSSLVYAALLPLSVIGLTLLYLDRGRPGPAGADADRRQRRRPLARSAAGGPISDERIEM